ncbi:Single-stranded DNA-binding protein [Aliarcobacter thereius]|uniref:Single-stranded DNA-binding protein n=2 Tax=Aliarcobacter thereius TaxID=544718 RepID=A0A1C0B8G8_9BACT|nr:single-stranded DNA-binding protein [Aliarcobacter thereius]OCL87584.1 Single-stranded DNA-binding protein [Aliarcobacter thereius]OCL93828.1 Single-stranded DNA-binding protein [Aliarcobacter thereius]OCL95236.1 Single-stranded DNA-binding protein [Aliarcobacter thereius LMG 24486]OCL99873.1 Single-stranded DNA-binding protein [Aliarcobacter thereius]QBF16774.1 single-stranded DNA binding protein [Aliarcobacter thereius LMG 24486]
MYNKVIMVGNLTRDIELKYLPSGAAIARSSIATSYKYKAQTGEQKEEVCFLEFNIFGRIAEVANQYLRKGSKVLLEGRLVYEQWTAQDGSNRNRHTLRVDEMKMLDSKGSNDGAGYNQNSYNQNQNYNQEPQQQEYNNNHGGNMNQQRAASNIPEIDIDDEIPF